MRTREEQIADMVVCMRRDNSGFAAQTLAYVAEEFLSEAEQRVRAEIGRDSERLDWVADNQCQFENHGLGERPLRVVNNCMGDKIASSYDLRNAIDAARGGG